MWGGEGRAFLEGGGEGQKAPTGLLSGGLGLMGAELPGDLGEACGRTVVEDQSFRARPEA
jgi:hypothetical protein